MTDNKITFGQSINRGQQDMPNNLTYSQMTTNIDIHVILTGGGEDE